MIWNAELGRAEYRETARDLAAQAITLFKYERREVPLREANENDPILVIDFYNYPFNHSTSLVTALIVRTGLPVKSYQLDEPDVVGVYALVTNSIAALEHPRKAGRRMLSCRRRNS